MGHANRTKSNAWGSGRVSQGITRITRYHKDHKVSQGITLVVLEGLISDGFETWDPMAWELRSLWLRNSGT